MIKDMSIQFVTDEMGNKKAVQIPFEEWLLLEKELKEFFDYRRMKTNLKSAFLQVKQIQSGQLPRRTMQNFLDEC